MMWLKQQLLEGWLRFEIGYISILLVVQIIAYLIVPDSPVGMMSGIMGVMAIVMGMKGRKITFIFGFIQCTAMSYIAWKSHAYGSFIMDIIYTISQPVGWFMWGNDQAVNTFNRKARSRIFIGAIVA
ncbi:nicotinamide mononucleotide transporter [Escherichia coli]|nr:nicotinamide mononucleotide transporter [Escherichia coli]OYA97426.1 nicotinamide mononucleotide transporter [Escherichia coli]OYB04297.1 nicotinamide mononucleotide transporter [Escherichia coli]